MAQPLNNLVVMENLKRILIVDEDPMMVSLQRAVLEQVPEFEVSTSLNVEHILELLRAGEVDAVVMDVAVNKVRHEEREINGIDLTRLIKKHAISPHMPVILVTALKGDRSAAQILSASGADELLTKPFSRLNLLAERVRRILDKQ